ncbi:TPA: (d)CMP kinase [Candidatus Nomurabacteria bacterium]|nr:(d)CMP kinase [Candidatus Nomurabacteria bacterium]
MNINQIPIIAIDGTASSGKGTIAYKLSQYLGFNYLNSGALYRLVAYEAMTQGVELDDTLGIIEIAKNIKPIFKDRQVIINGDDVWPIIGTQTYGNPASIVSRIPEVRTAIFECQRNMIQVPGLVAEGRDMCTHVFTDAKVKMYFDASAEVRAERRFKDEQDAKSGKTFEQILEEIISRDERDMNKPVGRLYPADDAFIIDSTDMNRDEVLTMCIEWCEKNGIK